MPDYRKSLGSGPPAGTLQLTLFIPSLDAQGAPINQAAWAEDALRVLGTLFRGATAFPPGRGVWRNDSEGGALLFEDVVMITSYADPNALTDEALLSLRHFLHRLGRETGQGEIGLVIGGEYHGITEYDPPTGGKAP